MRNSNWTRIVWTITAFGLIAAAPAANAKASKEENIGVGTGAVIGGLAAGPLGIVIGVAFGAKFGDKVHQKNTEIESLNVSLDNSELRTDDLESDVRNLKADVRTINVELAHAQQQVHPELISVMQAGISVDLQFRTDEYTLADTNGARLAELAQSLTAIDDVRIRLDGFADERGDADYNLSLSAKRVGWVRDQLIAAGIPSEKISAQAHGESPAQDEQLDSYALERRVSLKVYIDGARAFAANP